MPDETALSQVNAQKTPFKWNEKTVFGRPTAQDENMATIVGDNSDNSLTGLFSLDPASASDSIYGLGGNDVLSGGVGEDWLYGGPGDDTYILAQRIFGPAWFEDFDHNDHVVESAN